MAQVAWIEPLSFPDRLVNPPPPLLRHDPKAVPIPTRHHQHRPYHQSTCPDSFDGRICRGGQWWSRTTWDLDEWIDEEAIDLRVRRSHPCQLSESDHVSFPPPLLFFVLKNSMLNADYDDDIRMK